MIHDLAGNQMLCEFTANTGERNVSVVLSLILLTFLEGRVMLAVRQSSGTSPFAIDLRNIIRRGAMSSAGSFSSRGSKIVRSYHLYLVGTRYIFYVY